MFKEIIYLLDWIWQKWFNYCLMGWILWDKFLWYSFLWSYINFLCYKLTCMIRLEISLTLSLYCIKSRRHCIFKSHLMRSICCCSTFTLFLLYQACFEYFLVINRLIRLRWFITIFSEILLRTVLKLIFFVLSFCFS